MRKYAHSRSYVLRGGRLDICAISLLTICKLYEHAICEMNIEINVSLMSGLIKTLLLRVVKGGGGGGGGSESRITRNK